MTGLSGVLSGMGQSPRATSTCSRSSFRRFFHSSLEAGTFIGKYPLRSLGLPSRLSLGMPSKTRVGSLSSAWMDARNQPPQNNVRKIATDFDGDDFMMDFP